MISKIVPGFLATVGVILCQVHGGPFWVFLMAGNMGVGWSMSLLWEGMSIWLWWERSNWFVRLIPTVFLLFGMIFQSVSPLLNEIERTENTASVKITANKTLDKLMVVIKDQKRRGFKSTLDKLLDVVLTPDQIKTAPSIVLEYLPIVPLVGFPVMYVLCLMFVSGLKPDRTDDDVMKTPEDKLAEKLRVDILKRLNEPGMSYRGLAKSVGVNHSVLYNIVHREDLRRDGKNIIAMASLRRCSEKLSS